MCNDKVDENREMSDAPSGRDIGDPVEDPAIVFNGDGSEEDRRMGNEEKKTIFFFGQAGCLKLNSPVKTTPNNHKKDEANSPSSVKEPASEVMKEKEEDDGDNLLQKISEALNDEACENSPAKGSDASLSN